MQRIKDKIIEIREYLEELETIKPHDIKEYRSDIKEKAACERYVEKIMEAVTDLIFLIVIEIIGKCLPQRKMKHFPSVVNYTSIQTQS